MTTLVLVTPETLNEWWDRCEPRLAEATEYSGNRESAYDVYADLGAARKALWLAHVDGEVRAVMVTQILQYPNMRVLSIGYMTGNGRDDWLSHLWRIEEQARHWGCRKIEGWMRPGWQKALRASGQEGWRQTHIMMERDLWVEAAAVQPQ